jgi:hypothetical protein
MGRRDEAVDLLRKGITPEDIAEAMGISFQTVLGYLDQMIGAGVIRPTDVLFSLPPRARQSPSTFEEHEVVRRYGTDSHTLGDIYELLRKIETTLHRRIRSTLVHRYGSEEKNWWRQGVPERVRKKCAERREEDPDPVDDPYCYTDLLDLASILDANWEALQGEVGRLASNKRELIQNLRQMNEVRRLVMHPVRGVAPDQEDFRFLTVLSEHLEV